MIDRVHSRRDKRNEPPINRDIEAVFWSILDARGGESSFNDYQKRCAWRLARLIVSNDNAQSTKIEFLKSILPPEVDRKRGVARLPRDDRTLQQQAFDYAEMLRDGSYEVSPEEQAELAGVLDGAPLAPVVYAKVDLPKSEPVLGNEPQIIRAPPRQPLHTAEELADATDVDTSPHPSDTQSTEARHPRSDTHIGTARHDSEDTQRREAPEREMRQQEYVGRQSASMRACHNGTGAHGDPYRPLRR